MLDPDVSSTDAPHDAAGRDCPPGTAPGPNDSCVPVAPVSAVGIARIGLAPTLEEALLPESTHRLPEPSPGASGLRVMKIDDPAKAVEFTRKQLIGEP